MIKRPRALLAGDTVAIVAPASPINARDSFLRGRLALEALGFRVRHSERIFDATGYLAGDDRSRARELMEAFEDPEIRAVMPLRGGYGSVRTLEFLDPQVLQSCCKLFIGFSDLTTLHLYFQQQLGWVTIHGPVLTSPALAALSTEHRRHLLSLWGDPGYRACLRFPQLETWHGGRAEGVLRGGNLSLIAASLGTPHEISISEETVLFLEDTGEAPYRVDRMLTQLRLAGKLADARGILLGRFSRCGPEGGPADREMAATLRANLEPLDLPLLAGFPSGHESENWSLPLGVRVRLDADGRSLEILEATVE